MLVSAWPEGYCNKGADQTKYMVTTSNESQGSGPSAFHPIFSSSDRVISDYNYIPNYTQPISTNSAPFLCEESMDGCSKESSHSGGVFDPGPLAAIDRVVRAIDSPSPQSYSQSAMTGTNNDKCPQQATKEGNEVVANRLPCAIKSDVPTEEVVVSSRLYKLN